MTKRERLSATTSSLSTGRCAMSTVLFLPTGARYMTPRDAPGQLCPWPGFLLVRYAVSSPPGGLTAYGGLVLRVELDDQLLREDRVDLRTGRQLVDEDG